MNVVCAVHVRDVMGITHYIIHVPGIGQNASWALDDWLTSRSEGRLQQRELWFSIYSCQK